MKQYLLLLPLLSMFFLEACSQKSAPKAEASTPVLTAEAGVALLQQNCYSCHNPEAASHDALIAPPLVAARWRYLRQYPEKEAFIQHMTAYISNPTEDQALMRGPVRRFGVMPKHPLGETELRAIVTFLYEHEPAAPAWFAAHFEEMHGEKWEP